MKPRDRAVRALVPFLGLILLAPAPLLAYGGPGSIVSGIGTLLAAVAAVLAAIVGFFWFPVKRLLQKIRAESGDEETGAAAAPDVGAAGAPSGERATGRAPGGGEAGPGA